MITDKKTVKRAALLTLVLFFVLSSVFFTGSAYGKTTNKKADKKAGSMYGEKFIMVSLGDSYSSGEGNENFYGQNLSNKDKVKNTDWLCHRSERSWSGRLTSKYVDGQMSDYKSDKNVKNSQDNQWYFYASSGATTVDFYNKQSKTVNYGNKPFLGDYEFSGTEYIDSQLSVFDNIPKGEVDYVTFSIGGNDLGFVEILKYAALNSTVLNPNKIIDMINSKLDLLRDKTLDDLKNLYKEIENKAGKQAHIIVAGYPELLDETKSHLVLVNQYESAVINAACRILDIYLNNLIYECREEGMNIYYASVLKNFKGHGMDADDSYLNSIELFAKSQDINQDDALSSYSCHPNEKGLEAYANAVQSVINEIEKTDIEAVLVLDSSGSMNGTPLNETKKAAVKFCEALLDNKPNSSVGVVEYNDYAEKVSGFSCLPDSLSNRINTIYTTGSTNIEDGLSMAEQMLENSKAKKKIIVLMSDGVPNRGLTGSELINYAGTLRNKDITIYSLGFFSNLGSEAYSSRELMRSIAGSSENYFDVSNADDLVYFFGDISDQISGQRYVFIRVDCPVNVRVSYDGETLDSSDDKLCTRTDFGSLTFDESSDGNGTSKLLRLKEGVDYDIEIEGYDDGTMDYTISFMDENGDYTDVRKFEDIDITEDTTVSTVASNTKTTILKVDEDGDGHADFAYEAKKNGVGREVDIGRDDNTVYFLIIGVVIFAAAVAIAVAVYKNKKKKSAYAAYPYPFPTAPATPNVNNVPDVGAAVPQYYNTQSVPGTDRSAAQPEKLCPYCSTKNPSSSRFCILCGKEL